VQELLAEMVNRELLTYEQAESIVPEEIVAFFETELGQRLQQAENVEREVPFTMMMSANKAYASWDAPYDESVLVQGVIDCMMEEEDGIILIDFKTDTITGKFPGGFEQAKPVLEERYKLQLQLYSEAIEKSLRKKVKEKYLYFFDGHHILQLD
jgi:ATP-dependent helicase/nuclease subunit A